LQPRIYTDFKKNKPIVGEFSQITVKIRIDALRHPLSIHQTQIIMSKLPGIGLDKSSRLFTTMAYSTI